MKTTARLLGFLRPLAGWVGLSVLLSVATVACGIGLTATSAYLISAASLQPSIAVLQVAIVGVRAFGILRGIFRYLERLASHSANFRLLQALRTWFYDRIEPLAPAGLQDERGGDLLSRALVDIDSLDNFYIRALAPPLAGAVVLAGMVLFLAQFGSQLAGSLVLFWVLEGALLPLVIRRLSQEPGAAMIAERARLQAILVDGIQGMSDLLAFGQGGAVVEKIRRSGARLAGTQRCLAWIGGLQNGLSGLLSHLGLWTVLVLAIPLVRNGQLDGVLLAMVALASLASFEAAAPLPAAAQVLDGSLAVARRLFELADRTPAVVDPADVLPHPPTPFPAASAPWRGPGALSRRGGAEVEPPPLPAALGWERGSGGEEVFAPPHPPLLEIRNLGFRYQPDLPQALRGVSFRLEPGRSVALVGPSGAGKSTVVNLLLRFWEYQEGEILLDGQDIRRLRSADVRRNFGVIAQSTYLFDATLRQNLLLAKRDATPEQLAEAVRIAQLGDFIQRLPQGYDTWVGEHGLRLSGGERQRVAVARALLQDAPVLLLDEPTANLDAAMERQLLDLILTTRQDRSLLLITHRLVGLERMDEILVLRQGRVVERGSHADLMQIDGFYRRMWGIQQQII